MHSSGSGCRQASGANAARQQGNISQLVQPACIGCTTLTAPATYQVVVTVSAGVGARGHGNVCKTAKHVYSVSGHRKL